MGYLSETVCGSQKAGSRYDFCRVTLHKDPDGHSSCRIDVKKIFSFSRIVVLVPEQMRHSSVRSIEMSRNHVLISNFKKVLNIYRRFLSNTLDNFHGGSEERRRLILEEQMLVKILSLRIRSGSKLQWARAR